MNQNARLLVNVVYVLYMNILLVHVHSAIIIINSCFIDF